MSSQIIPNCIVIDDNNELIKSIKKDYPFKSVEDIKAEIGTFMSQSNMVDRFPTMKEMDSYYSAKNRAIEPSKDIVYNQEQLKAIEETVNWVLNPNTDKAHSWYTLEGKAGVGKTTVAKEILKRILEEKPRAQIAVATVSHKAKEVIDNGLKQDKTLGNRYTAKTLASLFGMKMNDETGKFERPKFTEEGLKSTVVNYDVILVDEASMVNSQAIDILMSEKNLGATVIFLGDTGQLPPIEEDINLADRNSRAFNTPNKSRLFTRVRQGEQSPILPYADYFWNNSHSESPVVNPISGGKNIITPEGSLVFSKSLGESLENIIDSFRTAVESRNASHIKIVAYRNNTVDSYNLLIHNSLFSESTEYGINEGEMLMTQSTFGREGSKNFIPNSYDVILDKVISSGTDRYGVRFITANVIVGDKTVEVPIVYRSDIAKYKEAVNSLWNKVRSTTDRNAKRAFIQEVKAYQAKYLDVKLGYAITSHKSQGSTYDISIVDKADILSVGPTSNKSKSQSIYTAITRARKAALVIDGSTPEVSIPNLESLVGGSVPSNVTRTPSTLNIYAGTGENAELSNFATRPFVHTWEDGKTTQFQSVEQAFQFAKARMANDRESARKILNARSGSEARSLGRQVKGLDPKAWDNTSSALMKVFIKESFQQNPEALQGLLATGNATLTHTQDKGKWGTEFPKLLMEVRGELGSASAQQQPQSTDFEVPVEGAESSSRSTTIKPEASMYFSYGNNKRVDVTANTTFEAIIKGERTATTRYDSEYADFWKTLNVGDIVPIRNTKTKNDPNKKVIYIRVTKPAAKLSSNTNAENWSKKEGWSVEYFNSEVKPRLSEAYQIEYEYIGNSRESISGLNNAQQPRDTQSEKEYADFSVLDEISNLTFRNAQRKADRVNLIAREFSKVVDIIYNQYTQRANSKGEKPQTREAFVANNADKIARIVKDATLNPYLLSEFDSICRDNRINPKKTIERVEFLSTNNNLVEQVLNSDSEARYKFNELQKIQDNWTILLGEAANILYTTEAINLDVVNMKASDNVNQEAENEDDITPDGENNVSLKDGWMVKARELDLRDTLSQETRKILSSIKRVDRNGNPDVDDLGMEKYLDPDTAHLILLEKISTIENSDEFILALEDLAKRHPWVNQVLQAIENDRNSNEFETILPKLYTDLRKEFLPYYIQVVDKDGKIITKQVNRSPSIIYLLNRWRDLFEQGIIVSDYSIYNKKGEFSKVNAQKGAKVIEDIKSKLNNLSEKQANDYILSSIDRVSKLLNMVGIEFSNDEIISTLTYGESIIDNLDSLLNSINTIFSQIVKNDYIAGTDLINEFSGAYSTIATLFNTVPQGTIIATFREAGRTRQSYAAPSYMGRLHNGIKNSDSAKALQFMEDSFGKYRQFKDETGYKNYWLSLMTDEVKGQSYRNLLDRKIVVHREGKEFNDWTETDYLAVALTEFTSSQDDPSTGATAYYALPLLADAPSAEFIKFKRITDTEELGLDGKYRAAKDIILDRLAEVAYSEWERIQLVTQRENNRKADASLKNGEESVSEIASFDGKSGKKFNFFPALNNAEFINSLKGKSKSEVLALLREAISDAEESSFEEFKSKYGRYAASLGFTEKVLEDFFYNNGLAYTQMVQLYTTDLAYYKNLNDFQKRFKEVYAMTNRLYTGFSDISKTRKVVYLKDITFTSPVLREIKEVLDKAEKNGQISATSRDYILSQYTKQGKKGGVNDTDAQGFVTLDSYKKVMRMIGNWTSEMERAKERFEKGGFSVEDFNIIWQTIKPFEFTHTESRSGVLVNVSGHEIPYGDLKVPTQYKNSEYLLMAIFNSIALNQSKSPLLRALNKWMRDNDIDLAQFESGVKTGNQAWIDLNNLTTEEEITEVLNNALRNPDTIHESSWEDYGIQSATPEHLVDHEALMGSQAKKLIMADLPEQLTISLQNKTLNRGATYKLFQNLLTFGYVEGFEDCVETFSSIENIAKAIQKEMAGNTRYTDEERKACTLRPDGKDFNVPLYDPIQFSRIQQLLNSIIKKKVTKQQSTGAACIQVSNVGLTDKLKIRFKDENGNLIFTEDEWLNIDKLSSKKDYSRLKALRNQYGFNQEGYKKYRDAVKSNSMAYMECYLPAYTKKFFDALGRTDGNFNIEDLPEELRRCLGYRIPTEAKYSMQSIYIKGFLPQENGSAIMLPSEITTIVGSDFDIDKVYLMLPNVAIGSRAERDALTEFNKLNADNSGDELLSIIFGEDIANLTETTKERKERFKEWLKEQRAEGKYLVDEDGMYNGKKDAYVYKPSVKLDKYLTLNPDGSIKEFKYKEFYREVPKYMRDNLILDVFLEVLSSPYLPSQQLKPGGFDAASKQAAIMNILNNMSVEKLVVKFAKSSEVNAKTLRRAFDTLNSISIDDLKKIAAESAPVLNPLSFDTQVYFHSQNANGGKMIGVYAVGNASHSIGEWGETALKEPFNFLGIQVQKIDNYFSSDGSLISENLANFLAASVDNVKDPVLKALNQDTTTGDRTNFLLRAGVPLDIVSLYMTTPIPSMDISKIDKDAIERSKSLTVDDILSYRKGILSESDYRLIAQALSYLDSKVRKYAKDLTEITQAFRGDAMSSAPGPSIGHNIIRILKLRKLQADLNSKDFSIITDLIGVDALLDDTNYGINSILEDSYNQKCPFVYAATKCGVTGSNVLLRNIFPQLQDTLLNLITNPNNGLSRYINLTGMKTEEAAKLVDTFYSELMLYLLQGTKYFGEENTKQKNLYYMSEFPQKFLELKEKYPSILGTNSLTKNLIVSAKNKGFSRIMFTNSGNLTKSLKETIANDWAMLLATQEQKETNEDGSEAVILSAKDAEEIRNLGFELFKYATNFGLEFSGGKSFIQLAPNVLRRAIKDYDRTVREIDRAVNLSPFISQFIHNHSELAELYSKVKGIPDFATDKSFAIVTKNLDYPKMMTYRDEQENLRIYEATSESVVKDDKGNSIINIVYTPMKVLGTVKGFKEYYYGIENPDTVIDNSVRNTAINQNDSYSSEESPYTPPTYDENYEESRDDLDEESEDPTAHFVYDAYGNIVGLC